MAPDLDEAREDVDGQAVGRRLRRRRAPHRHRGGDGRARSARCSSSATGRAPCRWCRRRTSSASATATSAPNTGGMGAYAPMPHVDADAVEHIMDAAVRPARRGAAPARHRLPRRALRRPHADARRAPRSLSTTCASATPRPRSCSRCWPATPPSSSSPWPTGTSDAVAPPAFSGDAAVCVVLASQGYPEHPRIGDTIEGLDRRGPVASPTSTASPSSTPAPGATAPTGPFYTAGGRVLGVTAVAPTLEQARARAYAATAPIDWEGMQMRHDIAARGRPATAGRREGGGPDDPALRTGGHGGALQRHGALRALARGRAPGHRGPGRPGRGAGRRRRHLPGQGAHGRRRLRGRRARAREGHGPRRRGLRRRGPGAHRRAGRLATSTTG